MGKRNISLLILTVVCFVVVLLGSVFSGNRRPLLSGVLGLTILICIIVQVITILKTARKNRRVTKRTPIQSIRCPPGQRRDHG